VLIQNLVVNNEYKTSTGWTGEMITTSQTDKGNKQDIQTKCEVATFRIAEGSAINMSDDLLNGVDTTQYILTEEIKEKIENNIPPGDGKPTTLSGYYNSALRVLFQKPTNGTGSGSVLINGGFYDNRHNIGTIGEGRYVLKYKIKAFTNNVYIMDGENKKEYTALLYTVNAGQRIIGYQV
jgi:hypothetical protein